MLTKIRAKNFKSLKDVTLDLRTRNVLVGANMAGKSNVIDLFKFVYDMVFTRQPGSWALQNAVFARGGFNEILWKGGDAETMLIAISARDSVDGVERVWDYEIILQGMANGNFQVVSEELYLTKGGTSVASKLIETAGGSRRLRGLDGRVLSDITDMSRSVLEYEFPGWPATSLRSAIASWRFYELLAPLMRDPNPTAATFFLQEHGENLSQWILYLQSRHGDAFARIQSVLKDSLPQVTGLFTSPTQQTTVSLGSYEKNLRRPVTLAQMSAGELAFIAYLSLIFSPAEVTGGLYCIEDLENYLHPRLIETLLEVLRQSQEEWERRGNAAQIIITTHSPAVVDRMKLEEIVFVEKRDGATVCTRPGDKPLLQKLLEDEEMGLGDLVYRGALSDVGK